MSTIPLLEGYSEKKVLVSPQQQIDNFIKNHKSKIKSLPSRCILAGMNPKRIEIELVKTWSLKEEIWLSQSKNGQPIKIYEKNKEKMVFTHGGGIGAPALCDRLELLIALGVKEVYLIGMCGGIQRNLKIGDIIAVTDAIRDEGFSYHYLKSSEKAKASKNMMNLIKNTKLNTRFGTVWTTDTMYRETISKYKKYKNQGVLGIDMETASAYAVAQYRKINMISLLIVSDITHPNEWNPQFHSNLIEKSVNKIIDNVF